MMSSYGVTLSLILLLFLANVVSYSEASVAHVSILLCFTKKNPNFDIFFFIDPLSFLVKFVMSFCGYSLD
jgi:hypothetical protein